MAGGGGEVNGGLISPRKVPLGSGGGGGGAQMYFSAEL